MLAYIAKLVMLLGGQITEVLKEGFYSVYLSLAWRELPHTRRKC